MWIQRIANLGGIAIIFILLISSLIVPYGFDNSADDSENFEVQVVEYS